MEVWRRERRCYRPAKVCGSAFHVKAMNKHTRRGVANEELGGCKQRQVLAEGAVAVRPPAAPGSLSTSLSEAPSVRVPRGQEAPQDARSGRGSLEHTDPCASGKAGHRALTFGGRRCLSETFKGARATCASDVSGSNC